jgi:AraC-like DNA-binding protein/mannose-6-phosphate isomerase-like protein (cupin superfamily)
VAKEHEQISLAPDETFRLLRWSNRVTHVEVVRGGQAKPIVGRGDHWHYHRAMELTFIEQGTGTRFVADCISPFREGDLLLIGSNVPHYWHLRGSSSGLSVQWDFPLDHGIWSFGEAAAALQALSKSALYGLQITGETAIATIKGMGSLAPLAGLPRLAAFLGILSTLCSAPADDVMPLSSRPFALNGTAEQQESMARAVSYILAHHRDAVRLEELLQLTGMSRATFARQFHRHVGKSFSVFLNQVRLQAVCRALVESTASISAIAFNHGFNQLSFFNRLFRREIGVSPSEYRRSGGLAVEG